MIWKTIPSIVSALVLIALIVVGGWNLGWWMKAYSVKKNAEIYQHSYERQTALQQEMLSNIATVQQIQVQIAETSGAEQQALEAQQHAIIEQVCNDNQTLLQSSETPEIMQFVQNNC